MFAGQTGPQECAGCGKKIHDKFILKVIIATTNDSDASGDFICCDYHSNDEHEEAEGGEGDACILGS